MAKKIVKKRKLKIFRLLLIILILGVIFFAVDIYLNTRIKNIMIKGNKYLKDDYILKLSGTKNYPSFYFTTSSSIKRKLEKSPYIRKVNISKSFYHTLNINVIENEVLFINASDNKIILSDGKKTLDVGIDLYRVPRLMNYVPDTKYHKLIKATKKINPDILGKISEMTYVPNDYDKDRFMLYMDDGNMVYLTLTKFKMINYYNEVLEQLDNRHGILYLDSGNHFQIKE